MIFVGIDPGKKNGVAVWDGNSFTKLCTMSFWQVIEYIESKVADRDRITFVVENPNRNKPVFPKRGVSHKEHLKMLKIAQNVGQNKRDAQLIIEKIKSLGFPVMEIKPSKYSMTKLKPNIFAQMTGFDGKCSEHARDAAMLVFGR